MTSGNLFHCFHNQLIVINCNIGCLINRRQFMLCRRNLVMLCFCSNAQLPELNIQVLHVCTNTLADRTKIMVFHFLSFWSRRTKQGTAGKNQVRSLQIFLPVHQEIFLLRSHTCNNLCCLCITEQTDYADCLLTDCLHGTKQRCFLIKCFTLIRTKSGRNTKDHSCSIFLQKRRRRDIPCCITSCLKRSTKTS